MNIKELKAAAGRATPGPWHRLQSGDAFYVIGHPVWPCARNGIEGEWKVAALDDMIGEHGAEVKANGTYIALANPSTILSLIAHVERLEEALTPSGETKADYWGEFSFPIAFENEEGDTVVEMKAVPWTTIKEIMAAIRARAALETPANPIEEVVDDRG